jgi:hypothetical protein
MFLSHTPLNALLVGPEHVVFRQQDSASLKEIREQKPSSNPDQLIRTIFLLSFQKNVFFLAFG